MTDQTTTEAAAPTVLESLPFEARQLAAAARALLAAYAPRLDPAADPATLVPAVRYALDALAAVDKPAPAPADPGENARQQASAQMDSVAAMVAAADLDWDRLQELRDARLFYSVGTNMPGYMPDNDPARHADADDARADLAQQMRDDADALEDRTDPECLDNAGMAGDYSRHDERAQQLRDAAEALDNLTTDKAGAEYGQTIGGRHYWIAYDAAGWLDADDAAELAELETAAGEYDDADDAERAISENALSVEIRSDWTTPGEEMTPAEFQILLCTGGPAVRIVGELDDHGEPSRAWLEFQDWLTPWCEYYGDNNDRDALLAYARRYVFAH